MMSAISGRKKKKFKMIFNECVAFCDPRREGIVIGRRDGELGFLSFAPNLGYGFPAKHLIKGQNFKKT